MKFECSLLLLGSLCLPLLAQPNRDRQPFLDRPPRDERREPGERPPQLDLQGLGLNREQQRQIRAIQQADQTRAKNLREQLNQAQQSFRRTLVSTATDPQILRQFERMQDLQNQSARLRVENLLRIRAVLTPQQREQLRARYSQ
ncbi:periplasmic heavy metal sensor [Candidatus Cyanaurora vandensis]|uniref:periplasmic heavy metal sensor n=1 Tax=Candidatus Cyanaurora vandensis TaxID=2714958 RepID=UPI00257E875B|nr:Spy/CpxP family protein refolding chaperone [Candidatus Cyanaurora vandensis]